MTSSTCCGSPATTPAIICGVAQVEQRGRLVHHQHVRLGDQHRRQRQQLLLPAGEQVRRVVGVPGEPVGRQRGARRARATSRLGQPPAAQPERDVLGDRRHHDLRVGVGEAEADPPAHLAALAAGCRGRRRSPSPRVGQHQPVEHPRERRLAGAVGADDADPRARSRRTVDVAQHRAGAGVLAVAVADAARPRSRGTLDHHRDALAAADRDGRQAVAAAPRRRTSWREEPDDEHRARRAPGVTEGQRPALDADPVRVQRRARRSRPAPDPRTPR